MECSAEDRRTCNNYVTTLSCNNGGNSITQGQDGDTMMSSDGQVLVYYNGIWGTICSDSWGEEESQVACREAGYQHGYSYDYYGERSKPMWLYAMECNGTETSLKSCQATELNNNNNFCGSSHSGVRVYCYNDDDLNEYRLVGGDKSNNGRVQVKYNNTWNYLCDDYGLYDSKATRICKQLGYKQGERYNNPRFANITGGYWKNYFSCRNNEPVLDLCEHRNWTYEANSCYNNPGIYCYDSVRLSSKFSNSSGALLVNEGNDYKTVCGDDFDQNAVNVVCRELGFPSGGRILPGNNFNVHRSRINKRYKCNGYEASLMECSAEDSRTCSNYVTTLFCSNGEVTCNNAVQDQDGDTMMTSDGQVLVYYHGIWGTICSDSWGEEESQVACREAGYQHSYSYDYYGERSKPMWLYAMECNGTETSLKSCQATELNNNNIYCSSSHSDARVYCYNDDDCKFFYFIFAFLVHKCGITRQTKYRMYLKLSPLKS
ncbi:scavenger receptor cysteine-rich type 1 protein M130 [Patella vulgata]|uniref:scavenger receptor cysteine-rich type 1 protein M130 n=1 Tax=Patella vulgata TaxID=6465 RepID=UPI0021803989|nr:scavenger receptor cysteine-rich type 1 protein M130 [Patella vulgata]